jgi:hypothetical protein
MQLQKRKFLRDPSGWSELEQSLTEGERTIYKKFDSKEIAVCRTILIDFHSIVIGYPNVRFLECYLIIIRFSLYHWIIGNYNFSSKADTTIGNSYDQLLGRVVQIPLEIRSKAVMDLSNSISLEGMRKDIERLQECLGRESQVRYSGISRKRIALVLSQLQEEK